MGTAYKYISLAIIILVLFTGCSKEIDPPSGVAALPAQPETPRGLTASIGDGSVLIGWTVSAPVSIARYMIYYTDDATAEPVLFDSSTTTSFEVTGLTNGRTYFFTVAAVSSQGIIGLHSSEIAAVPGVFSIAIAGNSAYTNTRSVSVGLTAPTGTSLVQLSESGVFADAHWESYAPNKSFTLSDGDGVKHVFARFQINGGGLSNGSVQDSITLDRVAAIDSVTENSGGSTLTAGDTIHFAVYSSETGGQANVTVTGLGTITLYEGQGASAGIYEADQVLPVGIELVNAEVAGHFTDAAGNNAPERKAVTHINATYPPDPVTLSGLPESSLEIMLEWSRSTISDFTSYRIFRSLTPVVSTSSRLVTTINNQATVSYRDTALAESTPYYYRVYVYDNSGNATPSNEVTITTLANQAPAAVTIAVSLTGDALSSNVTWSAANDADFKAYHLMRNDGPISGYNADDVISIINERGTTSFTDNVPSASNYYYQVFVVDKQGLMTGSNVISIVIQ